MSTTNLCSKRTENIMKTYARIMTSNIWGDYFGNPVTLREDELYDVYMRYAPDVIGMQEATVSWWNSNLFKKLKESYTEVDTDAPVEAWYAGQANDSSTRDAINRGMCNNQNYVPLFYKTDKYDCLESGWEHFEDTPDPSKCITWAVLKDKAAGGVFGVCATHYWWMSGDEKHDLIRVKNSCQMLNTMKYIEKKYSCAVFAFGDFNCRLDSMAFRTLIEGGCKDLQKEAKIASGISSHHGDPVRGEDGKYRGKPTDLGEEFSIDHIVALGNVDVSAYKVIIDQDALDATDHSPVYADVEI